MGPPKLLFSVTKRHSSPDKRQQCKKRQVVPGCLIQTFSILSGVLWLVAASIIVVINFKVSGKCKSNLSHVGQILKAQQLAKMDSNALGVLQLVAKALEIWFVAIEASLVFILVKTVARRTLRPALPLRYIFIHSTLGQFLALGTLLFSDPLEMRFKRPLKQIRRKQSRQDEGLLQKSKDKKSNWLWHRSRLYLSSIFIVLGSITCSLMGPATAILVLPNLQWTEINKNTRSPPMWLDSLQAGQPPHDILVPGCEPSNVTSGNFSCLLGYYRAFINSLAATAIPTGVQAMPHPISFPPQKSLNVIPILQEGNVTLRPNDSLWFLYT
ncbi:hypothetical protein BP5796_09341 [Coleophoma crateriformis]|uniref:Uncharacterized protein n=1 Tax=Coleophoma crateriformis TaxID=565419 RepID=A0A3D8QXS1_9HELO|nr:hypothetical protein BP5796_09341 [Coleophoma crateriformis]